MARSDGFTSAQLEAIEVLAEVGDFCKITVNSTSFNTREVNTNTAGALADMGLAVIRDGKVKLSKVSHELIEFGEGL